MSSIAKPYTLATEAFQDRENEVQTNAKSKSHK